MDEATARRTASASHVLRNRGVSLGEARELREGWYFGWRMTEPLVGCNGVIVNKQTGKLFHLGSAYPLERDLGLYDRGYQFESYDLVIVAVHDRDHTLETLRSLRLTVVEPEEAHGVVWKIPRPMKKAEIARLLDELPRLVPNTKLYFVAEVLEEARRAGSFTFELREHVPV